MARKRCWCYICGLDTFRHGLGFSFRFFTLVLGLVSFELQRSPGGGKLVVAVLIVLVAVRSLLCGVLRRYLKQR